MYLSYTVNCVDKVKVQEQIQIYFTCKFKIENVKIILFKITLMFKVDLVLF